MMEFETADDKAGSSRVKNGDELPPTTSRMAELCRACLYLVTAKLQAIATPPLPWPVLAPLQPSQRRFRSNRRLWLPK